MATTIYGREYERFVSDDDTRLLANVTRVLYNSGTSSYPARTPNAQFVEWVGPVEPSGALPGDTWVQTT